MFLVAQAGQLFGDTEAAALPSLLESGRLPARISGLPASGRALLAASMHAQLDAPVLAVCPDEAAAELFQKDLTALLGQDVPLLTARDYTFYTVESVSRQTEQKRLSALYALAAGTAPAVVCTVSGLLQRAMPKEKLLQASFEIRDGTSLPDRAAMLQASFDAGAAFTRASVGNVHAIAHTLGGLYGVSHGLANAVLLPLVLEDYGKAACPRLARLAALVGLKGDTEEVRAKAFIAEIRAMNTRMGIPDHFNCIRKEDVPLMATWAAQEANPVYPVPVIYDEARFARVIERSHHSQ